MEREESRIRTREPKTKRGEPKAEGRKGKRERESPLIEKLLQHLD